MVDPDVLAAELPAGSSHFVAASRADLAADLRSYGEDELALRAVDLTTDEMVRIGLRAGDLADAPGPDGLYSRLLATAAVEVMEGAPRELRRKRRRLSR
jgi:hypothetical protein